MKRRQKSVFSPLVVLGGSAFLIMLLVILPAEDVFPLVIYLLPLLFLAGILYAKGIKPVDPGFPPSLFWLAFITKLMSSMVNYWFVAEYYGRGDANVYYRNGLYVAQYLTQLDFSILETFRYATQQTTNFIFLTGLLYSILPVSLPGGFLLFASLAFTGSVFFYRAARLAFPDTNPNLFRFGIFFLPSILYWPASLGKDAWIFFASGLVAYGVAKYLRQGRLSGFLFVGAGLFLISFIRPHVAAFLGIAMAGAYLFSFFGGKVAAGGLGIKLAGVFLVAGLGFLSIRAGFEFLGLETLNQEDIETAYTSIQDTYIRSAGSNFQPYSVFEPAGAIRGIITVLFRPFPWEAHNAPALMASLESILLLAVLWARRRIFWSRSTSFWTDPWLAFLALYSFLMILGLTAIGNFGILARERVMFVPFFWLLFA